MFSHQGLAVEIWDDSLCFRVVLPSELRNMRITPQSCCSDQKRAISLLEHLRVVVLCVLRSLVWQFFQTHFAHAKRGHVQYKYSTSSTAQIN
jgi:hypothetical protein